MNPAPSTPKRPGYVVSLLFLVAGAVLAALGTAGRQEVVRWQLYWGLILVILGLVAARSTAASRRPVDLAGITTPAAPAAVLLGTLLRLTPAAVSAAFLATDPAEPSGSVYLLATVLWGWLGLSSIWIGVQTRRAEHDPESGRRRLPKGIRFLWAIVPGSAIVTWAVTAPGSSSRSCEGSDGGTATCFDGPIAAAIPGGMLLLGGIILGIASGAGKSGPGAAAGAAPVIGTPAAAASPPSTAAGPLGIDARLERLAELGRLRDSGVLDPVEFERLKDEVIAGAAAPAPAVVGATAAVVLTAAGHNKIATIKALRDLTNWGLAESKGLVDAAERQPVTLATGLPGEQAAAWKTHLEAAGASVQLA